MKRTMALLLILALAFCASGFAAEDGLLRTAAPYDMTTMDVTQTTDHYMVPMNVYDRLFEVEVAPDGSTSIVPSLCEGYEVSEDGLTYRFTLKEGIVFSNGNPLTADDVKYTFERLLTAGGVNDDVPMEVAGASELREGAADTLSGFAVEDDFHFSVTLSAPNAGFIAELTIAPMSIVDAESMAQAQNFGIALEDTIGTGAYRITEWVINDHFTLEYNENYWGEEPDAKKVVVNIVPDPSTLNLMYQNGELDLVSLEALDSMIVESTYKTVYADRLFDANRVGLTYLSLNNKKEFLTDVKVRKAIQMAIDVDAIVQSIFMGDAAVENGIIPRGVWGYNEALERPACDPEAARALLAEAGYADGQIHFEMAMDSSAISSTKLIYQVIQQQLKAIGMDVEIATYDSASWLDLRNSGEMDSFVGTWTMDYNDPANIMATFYGTPERTAMRSLNYADADIIARVAAAASIVDDEARKAEYQALEQKIVSEDAAWVPLLGSKHLFALSDRVESFTPYWAGYRDFYARLVKLK